MNRGPILLAKLFSAPASRNTEHNISLLRQLLPSATPGGYNHDRHNPRPGPATAEAWCRANGYPTIPIRLQ